MVVIKSDTNALKHYGVKGMKWDKDRIDKKTDKLEKLVEKTVEKEEKEGNSIVFFPVSDEKLNEVEAKVQREKEIVEAKMIKAQAFVDKQKSLASSKAVFKFVAPEKKRKAVESYLASLKSNYATLTKLKSKMASLKRKTKQPMR